MQDERDATATQATDGATGAPPLPPHIAAKLKAIQERQAAIEAERATRAAAASLAPSPEEMLHAEEAKLAEMEREEADGQAWSAALMKHGRGRVARVPTPDGIIVLRCMTLAEQDASGVRLLALEDATQRMVVSRELTLDTVVHPAKDIVRERTNKYPGLWPRLYAARDALAVGEAESISGKA